MTLAMLTGWDYLIGLTLVISVLLGLFRGLMKTVFALAGWVVAFVGAPVVSPPFVELTGLQQYPWVILVLAFFVLFILVRSIGILLAKLMSSAGLGGADRALGGLIGAARALLIVAVVAVVGHALGWHQSASWQQAVSRPLLDTIVANVIPYLPARPAAAKTS